VYHGTGLVGSNICVRNSTTRTRHEQKPLTNRPTTRSAVAAAAAAEQWWLGWGCSAGRPGPAAETALTRCCLPASCHVSTCHVRGASQWTELCVGLNAQTNELQRLARTTAAPIIHLLQGQRTKSPLNKIPGHNVSQFPDNSPPDKTPCYVSSRTKSPLYLRTPWRLYHHHHHYFF